jgi:hypothetical protein
MAKLYIRPNVADTEVGVQVAIVNMEAFYAPSEDFKSFVMPVCSPVCLSAWNNSARTGRIFTKFDI